MKRSKIIKFTFLSTVFMALSGCKSNPDIIVTDLYAVSPATTYSVGEVVKNDNFIVIAKYADNTIKGISEGYTTEPSLPYTFKDSDVTKGVDFTFSYKDKKASLHLIVIPKASKDEVVITFKNYNGVQLKKSNIKKGKEVTYTGEIPFKPKEGSEVYNMFIGWDKQLGYATENKEYTAVYKKLDKFIDNDFDGIPEGVDKDDNDNYFEVNAKEMITVNTNIRIDFSKFLKKDANLTYDNELAKLGLFLSSHAIDFKDGLFDPKSYGGYENALYARIGCDDFKHFDFKDEARSYTYDKCDTTSGVMAHKYLFNPDGSIAKDLIIIAFEGTNGKNRWISNFDVGFDDGISSDYYDKTGGKEAHPEWDFKNYHKGFYVAARRVLTSKVDGDSKDGPVQFLKYIDEHSKNSNGNPVIFITGHSRGGAMATVVGEYFENHYKQRQGKDCIPFTYSFASPAAWGGNSGKPQTSTVFNVINDDDLVIKVPFSEWGFNRLGDDKVIESINDKYKDKFNNNPEKREYQRIENSESILHNVGCNSRAEIYKFNSGEKPDKYISNIALNETSYTSLEDANNKVNELNAYYESKFKDFYKFIKLEIVSSIWGETTYYDIYGNACVGTIAALGGAAMANDQTVLSNMKDIVPLISNSRFLELINSIVVNIIAGGMDTIKLPHDYASYHIILREYKGN